MKNSSIDSAPVLPQFAKIDALKAEKEKVIADLRGKLAELNRRLLEDNLSGEERQLLLKQTGELTQKIDELQLEMVRLRAKERELEGYVKD